MTIWYFQIKVIEIYCSEESSDDETEDEDQDEDQTSMTDDAAISSDEYESSDSEDFSEEDEEIVVQNSSKRPKASQSSKFSLAPENRSCKWTTRVQPSVELKVVFIYNSFFGLENVHYTLPIWNLNHTCISNVENFYFHGNNITVATDIVEEENIPPSKVPKGSFKIMDVTQGLDKLY